jgi:hypothetical protein
MANKLAQMHKNSHHQNKNKIASSNNKNLNSQSIWQINLHKCSEANSLLVDDALNEAKRPIVLITEPFCNKNKNHNQRIYIHSFRLLQSKVNVIEPQ